MQSVVFCLIILLIILCAYVAGWKEGRRVERKFYDKQNSLAKLAKLRARAERVNFSRD
jgi:hypothetical protein